MNDALLPGVTYVECDIGNDALSDEQLSGADAVVWAAQCTARCPILGHPGPQGPRAIEYEAFGRLTEASACSGVKRFVVISSLSADRKWSWINVLLNTVLGQVVYWKYQGERKLATVCSQPGVRMKYTILRMAGLNNNPKVGPGVVEIFGRVLGHRVSRNDATEIAAVSAVREGNDRSSTFDCACLPEG